MKVSVHTSDGAQLVTENFDQESVMAMVEDLGDPGIDFLGFQMDDAMVYVNRAHIVRVDVE